jgi:hypothetical protein
MDVDCGSFEKSNAAGARSPRGRAAVVPENGSDGRKTTVQIPKEWRSITANGGAG